MGSSHDHHTLDALHAALHAAVVGSATAIAALAMSRYADVPALVRSLIGPAIAVPAVIGAT